MPQTTSWPPERVAAVYRLRQAGIPTATIALIAGVSRQRIDQICGAYAARTPTSPPDIDSGGA